MALGELIPEEKLFHIDDHRQQQNQSINSTKNNDTTTITTSALVFAIGPLSLRDEDKSCLKWLDEQNQLAKLCHGLLIKWRF